MNDDLPLSVADALAAMILEHDAGGITLNTMQAARAALAVRGEPVAWIKPGALDFVQEEGDALVSLRAEDNGGRIPLYAAPQAPLTLTDEQIDAIAGSTDPVTDAALNYQDRRTVWDRAFARAVLAAAQEKP
jgi:hypothetical protein